MQIFNYLFTETVILRGTMHIIVLLPKHSLITNMEMDLLLEKRQNAGHGES